MFPYPERLKPAVPLRFLDFLTALVWLINGLFCKVLNLVPRHQQIVARILGEEHAALLTKTIGGLEVLVAVWILSRIKPRLCAFTQVALVATMNIIEAVLAPDLLLFGYANLAVAAAFIAFLLWHEFGLRQTPPSSTFMR